MPGGAEVCSLNEEEGKDQGHDGGDDDWGDKGKDYNKAKDNKELVENVLDVNGELDVDLINIPVDTL